MQQGHEVHVFHLDARWPAFYYYISRAFHKWISNLSGFIVPSRKPIEYEENNDGVEVSHWNIKKFFPHKLPSRKELNRACERIVSYCCQNGFPDCFVGHWDNPQMEVLYYLKKKTAIPTALVLHNNLFDLEKAHGRDTEQILKTLDLIGFRSMTAQKNFISKYGEPRHAFLAYSGVAELFLKQRTIKQAKSKPHKYVFVGSLIKRKFPKEVLLALNKAYPEGDFELTYIGDGGEESVIRKCKTRGRVVFTGRIKREAIAKYLLDADCFIMISKDEIFGLVYLEAMACGCIPIGSINEGIDGIIKDGYNGFLCEAGNDSELAEIIIRICSSSPEERERIADNARKTAYRFTDANVASWYIQSLERIVDNSKT